MTLFQLYASVLAKTPTVIAKVRKSLFITASPVLYMLSPYPFKHKGLQNYISKVTYART